MSGKEWEEGKNNRCGSVGREHPLLDLCDWFGRAPKENLKGISFVFEISPISFCCTSQMCHNVGLISTSIHPALFSCLLMSPHPLLGQTLCFGDPLSYGIKPEVRMVATLGNDPANARTLLLNQWMKCTVVNSGRMKHNIASAKCVPMSTFLRVFPDFTLRWVIYTHTTRWTLGGYTDVKRINSSPVRTLLFRIADMQGNYEMLVVLPL